MEMTSFAPEQFFFGGGKLVLQKDTYTKIQIFLHYPIRTTFSRMQQEKLNT